MEGTLLLAGGTALLVSLGLLESRTHKRNLAQIPIRIHVNGTRGKSSVTRLIAAGLRGGGIRTCAKTTGTLARMILPDGSEYPVFRPTRANVIEQLRVVRAAVAQQAEALVVECMALQPALQALCERRIVRATHGVITNARADHLDVMGPSVRDVARALPGTVPVGGTLYVAEREHLAPFADAARDRRSRTVSIGDKEVARVTAEDLAGFSHIEHAENVALALQVCADLGVDRASALQAMWRAAPDPGVMTIHRVDDGPRSIIFVNGFAANDPDSTGHIWNMMVGRFGHVERRIALFNCRADRADRSAQLGEACVRWLPADQYVLVGAATEVFARKALAAGLPKTRLTSAGNAPPDELIGLIARAAGKSAMVMGMGNTAGVGMQLVDYYRGRSRPMGPHGGCRKEAA